VAVIELTDTNFQAEVRAASGAVLVDVWADWCGPCRLMVPLMEWAASEYGERLKVAKIDADPNPVCCDALKVRGLPTLILFRNGVEVARHEGALAQSQLDAFIKPHL